MATAARPDVYFIRHGETDWNAEGRYQGRQDIALNALGQAQADANGPLLHGLLKSNGVDPADFDWHVSPLSRARETMDRIRAAFPDELPDPIIDERLIEISFGSFEGELQSRLTDNGMRPQGARDSTFWDFRPHLGENYGDVVARIAPFIDLLTRPSIIVAHGGIARIFGYLLAGMSREEAVNWRVPQNAVLHFTAGAMSQHTSHLPSPGF